MVDFAPPSQLVSVGDNMIGSIAGGHVLARVSRRFGEGIVSGALTARVGIAAMDVCRPLPFVAPPQGLEPDRSGTHRLLGKARGRVQGSGIGLSLSVRR